MSLINVENVSDRYFQAISKLFEILVLEEEKSLESITDTKIVINSIAQDLISQISEKSGENVSRLSDKDICILTCILSFCQSHQLVVSSDENIILPLVRNVAPYAEAYLMILSTFDKTQLSQSAINSCLVQIKELFEISPENKALAIAHWINTRSITLDSIPLEDLDIAIAHIRIALVHSSAIDSFLPDILSKGINIEFLNIINSSVFKIPSLPKCRLISLQKTDGLLEIESQPECLKILINQSPKLEKISALDKCKIFAVNNTPSLKILPSSLPCDYFEIVGSYDLTQFSEPKLENLPDLPYCAIPLIKNCVTPISTIPIYGFSVDNPEEYQQKSGYTATCIGFRNTAHGKIYVFSIRDELNYLKLIKSHTSRRKKALEKIEMQMKELLREKYPALESAPTELSGIISQDFKIEGSSDKLQLHKLGYSYFEDEASQEIYFTIPSTETLINTWARLRETFPQLHPLKIQQSEGIASNFDFIKSWLENDVLISTQEEFLHDNFGHVIPLFGNITAPAYAENKAIICNAIKWALSFIQEAHDNGKITRQDYDSLEHLLGYFVDIMSGSILAQFSKNISSRPQGGAGYARFFTDFFNAQSELANSSDRLFAGMKNQKLQDDLIIGADLWKKVCRDLKEKS